MPDVERYLRKGPHIGHKMHLCELAERETSWRFKLLVKDSRFICRSCGRAAENLCDPAPQNRTNSSGHRALLGLFGWYPGER
jgi:hypothetical protein